MLKRLFVVLLLCSSVAVGTFASASSEPLDDVTLWRGGADTNDNVTPRPGTDTDGWPNNGLSVYSDKAKACGTSNTKAQKLSLEALEGITDLTVVRDPLDPDHYFLQGNTAERHEQWADTRGTGTPDPITTAIRTVARLGEETCQQPNP